MASVPRPSTCSGAGTCSTVMGSLPAPARMRIASRSASTTSVPAGAQSGPGSVPGPGATMVITISVLGRLDLQGGELVDLGLEGGQAGPQRGDLGRRGGVLVVVDDVLGRVADVGLEVLGPVEQVVHEVLGVVDDVLEEAGEGVLALGHGDQALAPASCSSASWLTLAVSSARAAWRPATSPADTDFSSSSMLSLTASFMSSSRSLARSRTSSTKSLVSSTMSSRNRVRVFLRLAMGPSLGSVGPFRPRFVLRCA